MEVSRNLQQVNSILNLAKLSESDVKKESHVLHFIPQIFDQKQVKLLEVNKETLEYLTNGERFVGSCKMFYLALIYIYSTHTLSSLYIKGEDGANAVVCSNSKTFELKEAETSNSLLLMPPLSHGVVVDEAEGRVLKRQEVYS